jgi:uncharacterized membrane protein
MIHLSLQILIVIWWVGAATATSALLTHLYGYYLVIGIIGWTIIITTTALIVYEIKKIKEENKKKSSAENKIK